MSYITSCLPLRGCRSLCTLENRNTFPCSSFTIPEQKTSLIVFGQRHRYPRVCVSHVGVMISAQKLYAPHKFLRWEWFLLVVAAMRWWDTILKEHWKTWIPLLQIHLSSAPAVASLKGSHEVGWYPACSLDSDFCKAVISAPAREILEKVNRGGSESDVCLHYHMLFHWDCLSGAHVLQQVAEGTGGV